MHGTQIRYFPFTFNLYSKICAQCSDPRAKEKFQQISIAYTKLISSRAGENEEDCDSEEEDGHGHADVHEMRAFMRMFMDLVGIFNDDQMTPEDGKLPNGQDLIYLTFCIIILGQVCLLG